MRASVVMPARDAEATIARSLRAICDQDVDEEYEVLVVDDGSRDRTAEIAARVGAPLRVLHQPPSGPAAARNLGVAHARGDYLAFCDADVFPTRGWLSAGLDALHDHDIVQGKVLPDPAADLGPFDRTIWVTQSGGLWELANLFVRRELFTRLGGIADGIQPRHGKALAEDVYFGFAATRVGARSAFAPDALAHHAVFPRRWTEYVAERTRRRYFPAMVRQAPELRDGFFYKRAFLDRRTARFDLGLAGIVSALLLGSPLPLGLFLPYLRLLRSAAQRGPGTGPAWWTIASVDLTADLVGLSALLYGSLTERSLVL